MSIPRRHLRPACRPLEGRLLPSASAWSLAAHATIALRTLDQDPSPVTTQGQADRAAAAEAASSETMDETSSPAEESGMTSDPSARPMIARRSRSATSTPIDPPMDGASSMGDGMQTAGVAVADDHAMMAMGPAPGLISLTNNLVSFGGASHGETHGGAATFIAPVTHISHQASTMIAMRHESQAVGLAGDGGGEDGSSAMSGMHDDAPEMDGSNRGETSMAGLDVGLTTELSLDLQPTAPTRNATMMPAHRPDVRIMMAEGEILPTASATDFEDEAEVFDRVSGPVVAASEPFVNSVPATEAEAAPDSVLRSPIALSAALVSAAVVVLTRGKKKLGGMASAIGEAIRTGLSPSFAPLGRFGRMSLLTRRPAH